jgi:hypothetical protein
MANLPIRCVPNHFKRRSESLLTILQHQQRLLAGTAEHLDTAAQLRAGSHALSGKTRLSIINPHFLSDAATVDSCLTQPVQALVDLLQPLRNWGITAQVLATVLVFSLNRSALQGRDVDRNGGWLMCVPRL